MLVIRTDEDGFKYAVDVPKEYADDEDVWGVIYGPPDLSSLNVQNLKALHNALVDRGFYEAPDLIGRRKDLKQVVQQQRLSDSTVREIVHVYQQDFYVE